MSNGYFVIYGSEDGIFIDGPLSAAELETRLTPNEHGDTYYGSRRGFYDHVPAQLDGYFNEHEDDRKLLIIKGEIVTPKAVQVATRFDIP